MTPRHKMSIEEQVDRMYNYFTTLSIEQLEIKLKWHEDLDATNGIDDRNMRLMRDVLKVKRREEKLNLLGI